LQGLRSLYLRSGWGMDDSGFVDRSTLHLLGSGKVLPSLEHLDLSLNEYVATDVEVFQQEARFSRLRRLCLRGVFLDGQATQALANAAPLANLRELDLGLNDIGDVGARALALSPHLRRLERLTVSSEQCFYEANDFMTQVGKQALCDRFGEAVVFLD